MSHQPQYEYFFGTLANRIRLGIVLALCDGEMNVSQLTKHLQQDQSAVSHGLRRLVTVKMVVIRKKGTYRYYTLASSAIRRMLEEADRWHGPSKNISPVRQAICRQCRACHRQSIPCPAQPYAAAA